VFKLPDCIHFYCVFMSVSPTAQALLKAGFALNKALAPLEFFAPVTHVYNPLDYAWAMHEQYVLRFGAHTKKVVMLGMNPGPFGMMQTGVPFGEVAAVRDWMGLSAPINQPASVHPKRPISGLACSRSEVSGRRLWGWAQQRFGAASSFFAHTFVLNYCPLVFLEDSGRNFTPDKLPSAQGKPLEQACLAHLVACLEALQPSHVVGIGGFAAQRLKQALGPGSSVQLVQILHPSPASPAANRGWEQAINQTLNAHGVFAS
jgi:single-strand selective monofunctional uracil DNA glycosylase